MGLLVMLVAACGSHQKTFSNPIYDHDFPDPFILHAGKTWYGYATTNDRQNFQEIKSTDLVHWRSVGDAMPTVPSWSSPSNTWAPEVIHLRNGRYAMYYVAPYTVLGR